MYVLRFFFDAGSGACLWSASEAARAAFEYAVDHHRLPIGLETRHALDGLIERFDASLDVDDPGAGCCWDADQRGRFVADATDALAVLRRQLPASDYVIQDELARA